MVHAPEISRNMQLFLLFLRNRESGRISCETTDSCFGRNDRELGKLAQSVKSQIEQFFTRTNRNRMGKKKKKKKKIQQKGTQDQLHSLTLEQLIEKGRQSLDAEKPRDAISVLKFTAKKHGQSDDINILLFRAYLMREKQLREKNMIPEADAIRKQAQEYMPWVDQLTEADMLAYISTSSNKEAFDIYAGYTKKNKVCPPAERFLANRLFKSEVWEMLDKLDESLPIRRDAGIIQNAMPLMKQGNWEDALENLGSVPRTSPYAPMRMFCRAMAAFYKEDDQDMCRSLAMIPDDFALANVAKNLRQTVCEKKQNPQSAAKIQCLWDGPVNIENDIRALLDDLEHRQFRRAERSIQELAEQIYPQDPNAAREFMLESIWNMTNQYKMEDYDYYKLAGRLLPKSRADLLVIKTRFLDFRHPFALAGQYISVLENEFPELRTRNIAHSMLLLATVEFIHKNGFSSKDHKGIERYKDLLGIKHDSKDAEMVLIDMTAESIRLDPYNRRAYEILVELPRISRPGKNTAEAALTDMLKYFPDDPYPCLELASLFYEKNAFRKAENILEEAMKRAPHDSRVIDRHALSLLISAEKNINRGKFHLVVRDIEKAEKLGSKKTVPFVVEKRIICQIVSQEKEPAPDGKTGAAMSFFGGQTHLKDMIETELAPLSLFDQLKVLAILLLDIKRRNLNEKKTILKEAEKRFNKDLKRIKELSSSDIVRLLTPLEKEYISLVPSREMAPVFLKQNKDILKNLKDDEVLAVYEIIFKPEWFTLIKKDIKRRTKSAVKKDRLLLEFYLVTIQHIKGEQDEPALFEEIIDEATGPMREELRAASRQLSKYASGDLKKALELFDFEILNDMLPFGDPFGGGSLNPLDLLPFLDDDEYDEEFDEDEHIGGEGLGELIDQLKAMGPGAEDIQEEMLDQFIHTVEDFVDSMDLRGAPDFIIMGLREILRSRPNGRDDFEALMKLAETAGLSRFSREARLIIFGRKRKK